MLKSFLFAATFLLPPSAMASGSVSIPFSGYRALKLFEGLYHSGAKDNDASGTIAKASAVNVACGAVAREVVCGFRKTRNSPFIHFRSEASKEISEVVAISGVLAGKAKADGLSDFASEISKYTPYVGDPDFREKRERLGWAKSKLMSAISTYFVYGVESISCSYNSASQAANCAVMLLKSQALNYYSSGS